MHVVTPHDASISREHLWLVENLTTPLWLAGELGCDWLITPGDEAGVYLYFYSATFCTWAVDAEESEVRFSSRK